jgi:hypothetical protein
VVPSPSAQPAEPKERKPLTDDELGRLINREVYGFGSDPFVWCGKTHDGAQMIARLYPIVARAVERAHGIQEQPKESKE